MAALNYAKQYQQALEQEFPYVLYFGALFNTPNNGRYRWVNSNVIEVPTITTTGRTDGNRDTIGEKKRNYNNSWTPLQVTNHRTWSTLVHPRDIQETNQVASIANITRVFNEEQKFPEMNCYLISKLYADYTGAGKTADKTVLTTDNVLEVFDAMMTYMDNKRVPRAGRILYVTPDTRTLITNAKQIVKTLDVSKRSEAVKRAITSIDEVEIPDSVPSDMMKTAYDFTEGWQVDTAADQINMCLVHPLAVITPINYEFAQLDPPSAGSEGKWDYFEESFEDVFLLPNKVDAIAFNIRVKRLPEIPDMVKDAICAMAEIDYQEEKKTPGVKSENSDGYAVTYADSGNTTGASGRVALMYQEASIYLGNTGLLYKGVSKKYDCEQ